MQLVPTGCATYLHWKAKCKNRPRTYLIFQYSFGFQQVVVFLRFTKASWEIHIRIHFHFSTFFWLLGLVSGPPSAKFPALAETSSYAIAYMFVVSYRLAFVSPAVQLIRILATFENFIQSLQSRASNHFYSLIFIICHNHYFVQRYAWMRLSCRVSWWCYLPVIKLPASPLVLFG